MNEFQEVFKRIEKKYLLDEKQYRLFRQKAEEFTIPDKYAESTICNIYFDTPDRRIIRTSLEKPVYKEKIRLRSYGVPKADDTVFVELKKKYKGVVYKRRTDMTLQTAKAFMKGQGGTGKNKQIEMELEWAMKFYQCLEPAMYISYDRTALCVKANPDLRITFDCNILYREEALELDKGVWGKSLLKEGQRIMEIKIPEAIPLWLTEILDELKLYPCSFSKYGTAYQNELKHKDEKGKVNCCA